MRVDPVVRRAVPGEYRPKTLAGLIYPADRPSEDTAGARGELMLPEKLKGDLRIVETKNDGGDDEGRNKKIFSYI